MLSLVIEKEGSNLNDGNTQISRWHDLISMALVGHLYTYIVS